MFSGLMVNTWIVATVVGVVAGVVGFFTVLRGSAFVAHAIPSAAFAGAAGASLIGVSTLTGLGVFAVGGALGIGWLGRRSRHDVATALALVMMLGLGSLFLSFSEEYAPEIYSLLFGEVLGVSSSQVLPTVGLAVLSIAALVVLYRPLMLTSVMPEAGAARGVRAQRVEMYFLVVVALATTMSVPVVGALLMFSLMIGPPAAARSFTDEPFRAILLSVAIALVAVWVGIAASYLTNWPVSFFVGLISAASFIVGRLWSKWRDGRDRGLSTVEKTPGGAPGARSEHLEFLR
jgi:zinc/manganese transport system permease protein